MIDLILPSEDEIRNLAYQLFELRGSEPGWDVADWIMAERVARFHKNYERVSLHLLSDTSETNLGTNEPRVCRFCGERSPKVTFKKEAHAIPAFLGNRSVFSLYECDDCNNAFGMFLEDHFAKMLSGVRTAMRIKGRKSVPSYKTKRKLSRIDVVGDRIEIRESVTDPVAKLDQENQSASLSLETQSFIPLAVYKCLAKIALSLMPECELPHFTYSMTWVRELDHARGAENFANACAYRAVTPGPFPERYGWVELFRRRHDAIRIPYMVLVVVFMNLTFQIYVPLCVKDEHLLGQQLTIPRFPAGFNCGYQFGETIFKNMNLSFPDRVTLPVEIGMSSEVVTRSP